MYSTEFLEGLESSYFPSWLPWLEKMSWSVEKPPTKTSARRRNNLTQENGRELEDGIGEILASVPLWCRPSLHVGCRYVCWATYWLLTYPLSLPQAWLAVRDNIEDLTSICRGNGVCTEDTVSGSVFTWIQRLLMRLAYVGAKRYEQVSLLRRVSSCVVCCRAL